MVLPHAAKSNTEGFPAMAAKRATLPRAITRPHAPGRPFPKRELHRKLGSRREADSANGAILLDLSSEGLNARGSYDPHIHFLQSGTQRPREAAPNGERPVANPRPLSTFTITFHSPSHSTFSSLSRFLQSNMGKFREKNHHFTTSVCGDISQPVRLGLPSIPLAPKPAALAGCNACRNVYSHPLFPIP